MTAESEAVRVTRLLREQILDGVRRPGDRLVERDLATELRVSRVPVREALHALATEGLVTPRPRSWSVVRTFTARDVADLHEVRASFEGLAFRLAARRRTDEGLARLLAVLELELTAARRGDAATAHRAAADFHEVVTELAGNELLVELHGPLRSRLRWLLGQHDDLAGVAAEHQALYDAIAARDLRGVRRLVARHLATGRERALERADTTDAD